MINNICINFHESIEDICKKQLLNAGFKLPRESKHDYLELLLNMKKRIVEPKKRNVHFHSSLRIPSNNTKGFFLLVNRMRKGVNINAYQSHHLERTDFHDGFLNDFGLHHFHLGETSQETGKHKKYIVRTKNEVFAKVDENDIYILGVFGHNKGEKNLIFTDESMLQMLYDEWPHLLERYVLKGISGQKFTPDERYNLRNKNANVTITLNNGIVIMSPGGGYMSNGLSADVFREVVHLHHTIPALKNELFAKQEKNYPSDAHFTVINFGHKELQLFSERYCFFTKIAIYDNKTKTVSLAPGFGPLYAEGFVPHIKSFIYEEICKAIHDYSGRDFLYPFPSIYKRTFD